MVTHVRWVTLALLGAVLVATAPARPLGAQAPATPSQGQTDVRQLPTEVSNIRFDAGQSVVPYLEGWIKNPDGTFDIVFGYFNRNWKEEFSIPAGPNNKMEPGVADGGQPTYFLPRRQRFIFRYRVPADFGKKVVTWTLTANGRTEKAYGDLLPAQELTERVLMTNGNFNPGEGDRNTPPTVTAAPIKAVAGTPVTLTAALVDDGLPEPRAAAPPPPPPPPTVGGRITAQVNSSGGGRGRRGPSVSWMQYRGPGKVTFGAAGAIPVDNGQASTTAMFAVPGTYVVRATGNDGALSKRVDVTVIVTGTAPAQRQP